MGAPSVDRVIDWLSALREADPAPFAAPLSPAGARLAWDAALSRLGADEVRAAASIPGLPYDSAAFVMARTVFTAPLEWATVLLARGTSLVLKAPHDRPEPAAFLARTAAARGLPLTATADRAAIDAAELVVAMGSDASIAAIAAAPGAARRLLFGSRFSVAWITDLASLDAVAEDAALHDGRGCMSPVAVATPLPADAVGARLAAAMAEAQRRWPRGEISPAEGAAIRTRRALAAALGAAHEGDGWGVHVMPAAHLRPAPLPRVLAVHGVDDLLSWLAPWWALVSTIGTDDASLNARGPRVCLPGQMQRPELFRLHDGVDWLRATLRGPGQA